MIFMIISQITLLLLNLAILILSKITSEFHHLIYVIPVIAYCVLMILFYFSYFRTKKRQFNAFRENVLLISLIGINVLFAVVETFIEDPNNPVLFYICTSVIQVINLLFLFNYMKQYASRLMSSSQYLIHRILSYTFVILSILTLYSCFVNIFMTVLLLIATSAFSAITTAMFLIAARRRNH